jgi:hypothetical protein
MLPALLAKTAGSDAWISAGIGTLVELAVLYIALTVLHRNQDTDIYATLRGTKSPVLGHAIAKTVLTAMFAMFLLQIFILVNQAFYLLNENMFESIPIKFFAIPMLILGVFFCFMPSRAIFRSGEIFFIFIIIGIALSVFPAVTNIDVREVLPIFGSGVGASANAFYLNLIYFESAFFLLMFMGDIKIEKHFRKKFMTTAVILGAFFVFFVFMFCALFGPLAPFKQIAVTDLTLYSNYITASGRLDWLLVTMWLLLLLLRFGITFFCAFKCLKYVFDFKFLKHKHGFISFILAIAVYFVSIFVFVTSRDVARFIGAIPWLIVALYIAVPVLFLIISLVKRRQKNV